MQYNVFNWTLRLAGEKIVSPEDSWGKFAPYLTAYSLLIAKQLLFYSWLEIMFYLKKMDGFSGFYQNLMILNKNLHIFQHGQEGIFSLLMQGFNLFQFSHH